MKLMVIAIIMFVLLTFCIMGMEIKHTYEAHDWTSVIGGAIGLVILTLATIGGLSEILKIQRELND